jgi:hypothetical protein
MRNASMLNVNNILLQIISGEHNLDFLGMSGGTCRAMAKCPDRRAEALITMGAIASSGARPLPGNCGSPCELDCLLLPLKTSTFSFRLVSVA